tara:strand:+ start:285 stop:659 length:375 start_codon:yes stop_codon:yes gene_type:complete
MKKDPLKYALHVEKAIREKYGEEAVQNPRSNWDEEKEQEYLEQIKELYKRETVRQNSSSKVLVDGVLIPKKLLNRDSNRTCPVCKVYSFEGRDDLYMNRYKCCFKCYVKNIQPKETLKRLTEKS